MSRARFHTIVLLLALFAAGTASRAQGAVRLVRSTSGTKGDLQGSRFVIADPRTTFVAGTDRQVIVYFEWEGSVGSHECKATWKDPSGAAVLIAPYPYQAKNPRFGVYWTLALPESPRLGLWAVEAEVDGASAGVHTFQIQESGAGEPSGGATRRLLSPADLYARAHAATVVVQSFDAAGAVLFTGSGFLLGERLLVTAFQVIEGATRLRLSPSTGAPVEVADVAAWNRRQDWAVLRTPPTFGPVQLDLDRSRSWRVGDRCSFIDTTSDGARVMSDTAIVGAQDFPQAGPRISLQAPVSSRSLGGPLLNEYGEAIGVLGGALTPGALSIRTTASVTLLGGSTAMAFPVSSLPAVPTEGGATLPELSTRGVFTPPLVAPLNVFTGTIARAVEKRNGVPMPLGEKTEFRRMEGEAVAFLTFDPQEKRQGTGLFRIFDIDNHPVLNGPPQKLSLRPRVYSVITWNFPLARLAPGTYRIDLEIDGAPAWRTYFRVVE